MNNIIQEICNFQLVIFGISVTLFTVLYSFILNKRDELKVYSEQIKSGTANPITVQRSEFAKSNINRLRKINNHLKFIITISFGTYLFAWIVQQIKFLSQWKYIFNIIIGFAAIVTILYIITILWIVFRQYNKDTKI